MLANTRVVPFTPGCKTERDNDFSTLDEKSWLLADWNKDWRPREEGLMKSCMNHVLDPNHRPFKYMIAILAAIVQGVLAFVLELPAGLEATIIRVMKMDNAHYGIIFSAYSWVDIVMSLVGSVIANKYLGIRKGFVIFMTIVMLGQLLCAVGCYLGNFWIFLCGRLITGCGYGTTNSILNTFQVLWFGGKEIAFVVSLGRMMCRTGATLALVTPQITYDGLSTVISSPLNRLGSTQMVGTLICAIGVLCTITVVGLDTYGAKMIGRRFNKSSQSISLLNMLSLPFLFWVIAISNGLLFGMIYVFTANSPLYFLSKYELNLYLANLANSLSYTAVIFITPLIALMVDFLGYNLVWGYVGVLFAISSCIMYIAAGSNFFIPFIGAVLISLAYSFFGSSSWVSISLVVKPNQITTAYGVALSVYNLTLALIGAVAGVIVDNFGYFNLVLFNLMCLFPVANLLMVSFVHDLLSENPVLLGKSKRKR